MRGLTVYHLRRGLAALLILFDGQPRPDDGVSKSKTPTSFVSVRVWVSPGYEATMLNYSTYLFGDFGGNYFQYPCDYMHAQLQRISSRFDSESQIVVYREHSLMCYAYMLRTEPRISRSFVGICLVVNGLVTYKLSSMFRMFEASLKSIVLDNRILTVDEEGKICYKTTDVVSLQVEYSRVVEYVREMLSEGERFFVDIPVFDCSISTDDCCAVPLSAGERKIMDAINGHKFVYVMKNSGISAPDFNGLTLKISQLNNELKMSKALNEELQNTIKKMNYSKSLSHFSVALMILILAASAMAFYLVKNNLIQLNF